MVGRNRKVPLNVLYSLFEENKDEIIDDNKVVAPSNQIWQRIHEHEKINKKSTPKAIYNDALRWYEDNSEGKSDKSSEADDISDISIEISPPSDSDESYMYSEDETPQPNDINFTISLSYEVWKTIQPIPKEHRRQDKTHNTNIRIYHTLPAGLWTNVLIERIAQHRVKNPCTWTFKRAKVYQSGKKYITISAKCTTCGALLIGQVVNEPKEGDSFVKLKFVVRNFNEEKHADNQARKNVRIGGSKAVEIFSSEKKASVIKRNIIKKSGAEMFEQDKGRVVSENAIRAGQCRLRQLNKLSVDPIQSLQFMKASNAFGPMIHWLGVDPFFVIYGNVNQFILFNAYKKHNKYTKITCDATGSIAHKLST